MEGAAKNFNKALMTIGTKPAIAHIIDQFPKASEIVVPIGYKGKYVKQVLQALYPDRKITFVEVDVYEGHDSGLGRSLNCARKYLQSEFIFCSNDTIVGEDVELDPNIHGNWMAYHKADDLDPTLYRTLNIENDIVTLINTKGVKNNNIYIGLCGVKDYKKFWKLMDEETAVLAGESYGMKGVSDIKAINVQSWFDTGNPESLERTKAYFKDYNFNILEKEDEAIWFHEGKVIKFALDTNFIQDRIIRTRFMNKNLLPKITRNDGNLYVYNMRDGKTLSTILNTHNVVPLLEMFKENMWTTVPSLKEDLQKVRDACWVFYKDKTYDRVKQFLDRYEMIDREDLINGIQVPKTFDMLDNLNWAFLCDHPHVSYYHGDLHNENIISGSDGITLLDWRQGFSNQLYEFGDAYYDFAKLNHGFIVSHDVVNKNGFEITRHEDASITIDIDRPFRLVEVETTFHQWLQTAGYQVDKVRLLTALIFLNISPLHEHPYSLFLYYLGKYLFYSYKESLKKGKEVSDE